MSIVNGTALLKAAPHVADGGNQAARAWGKRWVARIMVARKHVHLGYFTDIKDAERAYVAAATKMHGEFTRTSLPAHTHERMPACAR